MREKGVAVVGALALVAVTGLLSLAMVWSVVGGLRVGGNFLAKAQARQLAEAALDRALVYLQGLSPAEISGQEASFSGRMETGDYRADLTCAESGPRTYRCEVRSFGEVVNGAHEAKALVEVVLEDRSFLKEGWFTGGIVTVNGDLQLMGTRLHGDGGYSLNGRNVTLCDAYGENCHSPAENPLLARRAITAGIAGQVCNAREASLCPPERVCPTWDRGYLNDDTPCYDSLRERMATVSTASKIPPPDIPSLYRSLTGLSLTENPYSATVPETCDREIVSISDLANFSSGTICLNGSLTLSSPLVVPEGVRLVIRGSLTVESRGSVDVRGAVYVQGNWNVNRGAVSVKGGRAVVGGDFNASPNLEVREGTLLVGGNLNLAPPGQGTPLFEEATVAVRYSGGFNVSFKAVNSKVLFGANAVFSGNAGPELVGNSALIANGGFTFNGTLQSGPKGSPLLVSGGDVTFNGAYRDSQSASYIWATGTVRMNGNTVYRGGIASGGGVASSVSSDGIVVNGGLALYRANLDNELLPKVDVLRVRVSSRR